jgi:intein-encoded DNA endonuclease-like protein
LEGNENSKAWLAFELRPYQEFDLVGQIEIYHRAMELRALGFTYRRISSGIRDEFGAGISKRTLITWTKEGRSPMGRARAFFPVPTPELAYIIGVERGDGSLNVRKSIYSYRIRLQSVGVDFVEEFNRCLTEVLKTPRHSTWKGAGRRETHVEASSFLLYRFLRKPFEDLKPFIEHCANCSAAFLRGFFDSECCVSKEGSLTASNCDVGLLRYVQRLLLGKFDIETTGPLLKTQKGSKITRRGRTYLRNSDCYAIRVRNAFRRQFSEEIGLTILRKKRRLERAIKGNPFGDN